MTNPAAPDHEIKNLKLVIVLSAAIFFGWKFFYEMPREQAFRAQQATIEAAKAKDAPAPKAAPTADVAAIETPAINAARIRINTPSLHGSISTAGGRFDDLTLAQYHEEINSDSPEVKLLNRTGTAEAYYIELGMLAQDASQKMPDGATRWQTSDTELTVDHPVTLTWNNGSGLKFTRTIAVDEHSMFTVTTNVKNDAATPVTLYPYGLISRNYTEAQHNFMHEGPLGVSGGMLEDYTYKKLREDGTIKPEGAGNWVGIADKYWLTALIPDNGAEKFETEFKHFTRNDADAYQADMRGSPLQIAAGDSAKVTTHVFAGAKVMKQLDAYAQAFNIPLFDRAVDFGSLYFIMKPIFTMLSWFYSIVGNFGVAIILLTICIKACLFPLASKSMTSMSKMKVLQPKMTELKERHKGDKMKLNQEIMALYKREKVNPVSGCLPILIQIPIFLSLYRVLSATIEMRHAPFFGWIHDLSVSDQTNIFTGFGLLPWDTHIASYNLHLGILPMVMCATMIIQQRLNPKPADPVQAAMMNYMPFVFLVMFASFPAGVVIYWICNNTLSILQQLYINQRLAKQGLK